jgi:hypothetical protein
MRAWIVVAASAPIALLLPISAARGTVALSSDTTITLGGTTFDDQEPFSDNQMGTVVGLPLGTLPDSSDVDAYHFFADGDQLYSLDTTVDLGGGLTVGPADVVRFDGATDTVEYDASAEGIPDGAIVDAVTVHSSGDLMLSFDTTLDLGGGVTAEDDDLVRFDGGTTYSIVFDGSAQGVPSGLDLDGADFRASDGHLLLSFNGSGALGSVDFEDEDILEFDPVGTTWTLFYDGSAQHPELAAADLIALPEPHWLLQQGVSIALLGLLTRTRSRRGS